MIQLAYIDPGAGSIILQSIIAALLGIVVFFRNTVKRVFVFLFARRAPAEPESPQNQPES